MTSKDDAFLLGFKFSQNIKIRFSRIFLRKFLDEQFMGDFTYRDLASRTLAPEVRSQNT